MNSSPFHKTRLNISTDLQQAIKAQDRVRVGALRAALNVLDNTKYRPRHNAFDGLAVSKAEIASLPGTEAQEHASASIEYRRFKKPNMVDQLRSEARIIRSCLKHV